MNIFYLHSNPKICAQYHVDKHVNKMILETTQLLCWAYYDEKGKLKAKFPDFVKPYKFVKSHYNHPCAKWTRKTWGNWRWLCLLGFELCREFEYRFGKEHKTRQLIAQLMMFNPLETKILSNDTRITRRPQCFGPFQSKCEIPRKPKKAYRKYYRIGKKHLHKYTKRTPPKFLG